MDKVLVVDDDIDILTLVKMSLKLNGFEVETISRWEQVSKGIENFSPDLVLLDVSLGGADGREICKKIKSTKETEHIPVILFSANAEMGRSVDDCGAQAFVAKPYELSHMLKTIREAIAESKVGKN
jgi:DNA-binding response OmpR family regulator